MELSLMFGLDETQDTEKTCASGPFQKSERLNIPLGTPPVPIWNLCCSHWEQSGNAR